MADTATDLLNVRLCEVGVKTDWGGPDGLNETIQMLENGTRGRNAIALTGNLTLNATNFEDHTDHYRYNTLIFSDGGLSSQPTITAPDKAIWWFIKNTGSTYDLTFKCSGTGVTIPQGRMVVVFSDGTDCELYDPVALATAATAADVVATNADVVTTNADVVLTGLDVVATNADVVTTNADVVLTNADVVLTGLDVVAAAASADAAAASAAGVNLPSMVANTFLQANSGATAYETKTAGQVLTAIGGLDKTGDTMSGPLDMGDNFVTKPILKDFALEVNAHGNTGATETINLEDGNYHTATVDQATTLTFSNPIASGDATAFSLELTNGGAFTVTWPVAVSWDAATAPTLQASGVDILTFVTIDAGATWRGFVSWAAA